MNSQLNNNVFFFIFWFCVVVLFGSAKSQLATRPSSRVLHASVFATVANVGSYIISSNFGETSLYCGLHCEQMHKTHSYIRTESNRLQNSHSKENENAIFTNGIHLALLSTAELLRLALISCVSLVLLWPKPSLSRYSGAHLHRIDESNCETLSFIWILRFDLKLYAFAFILELHNGNNGVELLNNAFGSLILSGHFAFMDGNDGISMWVAHF